MNKEKVLEEINDNLNVLAFFKFKESCDKSKRNNECVKNNECVNIEGLASTHEYCIKCFNEFKVKLTQNKF